MLTFSMWHIAVYLSVFLVGIVHQPNWAYENFWSRADFWSALPFRVPFEVFQLLYAAVLTIGVWGLIKLVKRYL